MLGQDGEILWLARPFACFAFPIENIGPPDRYYSQKDKDYYLNEFAMFLHHSNYHQVRLAGSPRSEYKKVTYLLTYNPTGILPWGIRARKFLISLSSYAAKSKNTTLEFPVFKDFLVSLGVKSIDSKVTKKWKETIINLLECKFLYHPIHVYDPDAFDFVKQWDQQLRFKKPREYALPQNLKDAELFSEFKIADDWSLKKGKGYIKLSDEFMKLSQDRPVPLAAKEIQKMQSAFRMDLYCWLSANRKSHIEELKMRTLQLQIGGKDTGSFCKETKRNLIKISQVWPGKFNYVYYKAYKTKQGYSRPAKITLPKISNPVWLPKKEDDVVIDGVYYVDIPFEW